MRRIPIRYLLAAGGLLAFAGAFYSCRSAPDQGADFFGRKSFYIVFGLLFIWVMQLSKLVRVRRFSLPAFVSLHRWGLAMALALTVIAFVSVPVGFKTLSDETNLLSVSQSMVNEKTVWNATMGKFYYGNFNPVFVAVPTRPLVFPFFEHILHVFLGYRHQNAFVLNGLVFFCLLTLIHAVARRKLGEAPALAAQILVASYPILMIAATSGGFDLLSAFFCGIVLLALHLFMRDPEQPETLPFLWASVIVFANIRYESIVFIPILWMGLFWGGYLNRRHFLAAPQLYCLTPLFFLPFLLQRLLTQGSWEAPPGIEPFSLGHLWEHLGILLRSQLDFGFVLPYSLLVNLFAGFTLVYLGYAKWKGRLSPPTKSARDYFRIVTVLFLVSLTLFLMHHMGVYTHPTQARFFILLSIACALAPLFLRAYAPSMISDRALVIGAVAAFVLYHPAAVHGRFIHTLILNRETEGSLAVLGSYSTHNLMVIADRPGQYASLDYGAVDFTYANSHRSELMLELRRRLFQEILVFQRVGYDTRQPVPENALDPEVKLQMVHEEQVDADHLLRISKVLL